MSMASIMHQQQTTTLSYHMLTRCLICNHFAFSERVSAHKRLRGGVCFVSEIPRNPSGKLLRRVLRSKL